MPKGSAFEVEIHVDVPRWARWIALGLMGIARACFGLACWITLRSTVVRTP
jgi:hypothetical protein